MWDCVVEPPLSPESPIRGEGRKGKGGGVGADTHKHTHSHTQRRKGEGQTDTRTHNYHYTLLCYVITPTPAHPSHLGEMASLHVRVGAHAGVLLVLVPLLLLVVMVIRGA
jgi:hypothetical protein